MTMLALLLAISLFRDPATIATKPQNAFAVLDGEILIASGSTVYRDGVAVLELPAPILWMTADDGLLAVFIADEAFLYREYRLIERRIEAPPGATLQHDGKVIRIENGQLLGHRVPSTVTSLAAGDMNGDGLDDITFSAPDVIGILLANGDGTFAAPRAFRSGGWSVQHALYDFDRDGDLDVLAGGKGERVLIIENIGNGALDADPVYFTGPHTRLLAADLAFSDGELITIAGSRLMRARLPLDLPFAAGDVNGDGRLDVVHQAPSPRHRRRYTNRCRRSSETATARSPTPRAVIPRSTCGCSAISPATAAPPCSTSSAAFIRATATARSARERDAVFSTCRWPSSSLTSTTMGWTTSSIRT